MKLAKAVACLKSLPRGRNGSSEFPRPSETSSPPLSPLCPWIHGLVPAIEFVVAPSSPLPNSSDPGATLARACLHSGDFTAAERCGAARSRLFPQSDFPHQILIARPGPRDTASRTRA
jgi:hypothetical protein